MDALAFESHFVDHVAPIWHALPERIRGTFYVEPSLVERAKSKGIDAVAQERIMVLRGQMVPVNHGDRPALVASYGDIKEGRRLGYGPFVFLEHGAGQQYPVRNGSYAGGPDRADNELILVPNETCAGIWRNAYPQTRVEVVGCPKLDSLPAREGDGPPVVALSWHWPAPLSLSGFAGTAVGEYLDRLAPLAQRYRVIGHAHPKTDWPARMERHYKRAGIEFVPEFEDVCRRADVYVADNTSTLFEFAATGRPVVLLNASTWTRKANIGLRFWDAAHVGINVWPKDDLFAAIDEALEDPPERQRDRENALSLVYGVRSGGAQLAADAITNWLTNRASVAA